MHERTRVFLGVDVGSISTKGVIINNENEVLSSDYIWTEGNPIEATKQLIRSLQSGLDDGVAVTAVGVTGSARKLVGAMLGAQVTKNEITAHAVGTLSRYPQARTILEIGGQDSKLILLDGGVVVDYAMNTLCAAGTGAFLSSQAKRLGVRVEDMGAIALTSQSPSKIAARCTVFAESDMIHKAQTGHKKEDLIAGLCHAVAANYLNNLAKGKRLREPVVFQGGVSKNAGVVRAFEEETGFEILVDPNSHLMGAVGAAILAKEAGEESEFDFHITDVFFSTVAHECEGCSNRCEVVSFLKDGEVMDLWGNRCPKGAAVRHAADCAQRER
ncbi:MAG: acyl-CoA dehydratase activase [Oscillospiraceae bacterium]|jgi:predicted CoA-substrate-specific enzyme activase|nr:acyl-CoA dehydratase activase [Oscillospiraceae bacterium]